MGALEFSDVLGDSLERVAPIALIVFPLLVFVGVICWQVDRYRADMRAAVAIDNRRARERARKRADELAEAERIRDRDDMTAVAVAVTALAGLGLLVRVLVRWAR